VKIGVLSDTHGYVDERFQHYFKECDEIWHAGDIGSLEVINYLKSITSCKFVSGNIDGHQFKFDAPDFQFFTIDGLKVLIRHIVGKPGLYNDSTIKQIRALAPNILVCGHSHIVRVEFFKNFNLLHLNPGAAGIQGFHQKRTLLRFEINKGKPEKMELIELGNRAKI
jgi:putative phosphoesterase